MCTATLKQELYRQVDNMPDENVRLLIEVAKSMMQSVRNESAWQSEGSAGVEQGILGIFEDRPFFMTDDFCETPECFKEYV